MTGSARMTNMTARSRDTRPEQNAEQKGERDREHPSKSAYRNRAAGARVIQSLSDSNDHREEHPHGRNRETRDSQLRQDAGDAHYSRRGRKASRPQQLADVNARLRTGKDARANLEHHEGPRGPGHEREGTKECDVASAARTEPGRSEAGRHARQHHDRNRLASRTGIGLDLLVRLSAQRKGADQTVEERVGLPIWRVQRVYHS